MGELPANTVTSTVLLEGLCSEGDLAWSRFTARYRPMLIGFASKLGLAPEEAEDAAQETLLAFVKGYRSRSYDRRKGRLRSWLFGIARHKVADIKMRRRAELILADKSDGSAFLASIPAPGELHALWEQEWERAVLHACLGEIAEHVDPRTRKAFELSVLEEWAVQRVAEHLGMTPNAVYLARNRVLTRIRALYARMEADW